MISCVNYGNVLGSCAGGIIGDSMWNSSYIKDCLNFKGAIVGWSSVGGGYVEVSESVNLSPNSDIVKNSYNTSAHKMYNVYTLKQLSITGDISYENQLSFTDMKNKENFRDFDFEKTWKINDDINSGFPNLIDLPQHLVLNECVKIMSVGEMCSLYAYLENNAQNVTWQSDDNSVAAVSANGCVTAKKNGYCTVTATNVLGMKAICLIYVQCKSESINLNKQSTRIESGKTEILLCTLNPTNANETVWWYSDNTAVASVNQKGVVKANKKGYANIYSVTTDSQLTSSCMVEVVGSPITGISISSIYETKTVNVGDVYKIPFTVSPTQYSGEIYYTSSHPEVAVVSDLGEITAKTSGTTIITAKSDTGYSATCTITVKTPATSITLNKNELTLEVGYAEKLTAYMMPTNTTDTISWSSSSTSYVTVASDGTVTAKNVGQATVTATTTSKQKAYCVVKVVNPVVPVASVTLNKTSAVLTSADKIQLNATILPENATDKSIVWKSSDEAVATVSNTGVVSAVSPGNATITATSNNGYYHECNIDVVSANGSAFIAKSTKASAGEIAEYTVSVVKNPGISAYKLSIDYDTDMLEAIDIISNNDIAGTFKTNIEDTDRKILNVLWYADEDYSENSDLFTVKFKVKDTAENGKMLPVTLSYNAGDVCNSKHDNLAFFIRNTEIEVSDPLPGDVYGDGVLNVHDILLLSRYITGLETLSSRQLIAANLIEDDVVDIKDTVKLAQVLLEQPKLMMTPKLMSGENSISPTVTVGSAKINDAKEIDIPVLINNNTGIAGFNFKIDYNVDELEIISITPNTDVITNDFKTNLGNEGENGLLVSWYNAQNINTNGILFTIKAKCKKSYNGISAINIVSADNNFCDDSPENVLVNYANGEIEYNSFIKENETIENGTYSADLYFDNSYEKKSAVAILALYDKNGKLITLSSKDITVKPGKENISVTLETAEFDSSKLFIWDSLENLKPIVTIK